VTLRFPSRMVCASLAFCASAMACADAPAPEAGPRKPATQYVVGIDISGSRTVTQLKEAERLLEQLIGRMSYGDRIVLVETYQTNSDAAEQWDDSVPPLRRPGTASGSERNRLAEFHERATTMAGTFFDTTKSKTVKSTDLLMMLARAADYATASGGRKTTLLVLSDMLNSTPEVNMERVSNVPTSPWIAARKAEQRLPDLRGVCVFIAGADVTTRRGAKVRAFWSEYLSAAGAELASGGYRNMLPDASEIRCSGATDSPTGQTAGP